MKVLVVGGAGYIGAHMVRELVSAGLTPVVLDNLCRGHREQVPEGVRFVEGDLGDESLLDRILPGEGIEAVMHFAAYSLVGESVAQPLDYYANNVAKTTALLRAMERSRVGRFIFSSTAAVYGAPEGTQPIKETDPRRPVNPYGWSKMMVEQILEDSAAAWGLRYTALRYFNAAGAHPDGGIGEHHEPETHLIPIVLEVAAGKRAEVGIFGTDYPTPDGTCLRDYVHVCDLAKAHLLALEALDRQPGGRIYNLGNSRGHSVREVIRLAERVSGRTIRVKESARRAGDPPVLVADSSRARAELGWKPRFESLEEIVATAWQWHRQ